MYNEYEKLKIYILLLIWNLKTKFIKNMHNSKYTDYYKLKTRFILNMFQTYIRDMDYCQIFS